MSTTFCRVTVQETYLLEPQNAAGAIDSFLSRVRFELCATYLSLCRIGL